MNSKFKLTVLSTMLTMASLGNYAQASVSLPTTVTSTIAVASELAAPVPTFTGNTGLGSKIATSVELGAFSYTNTNNVAARLSIEAVGDSVSGKSGQGGFYNKDLGDKIWFTFSSPDGVNKLNGISTKLLEQNEVASVKLTTSSSQQVRPGTYTLITNASMWN